jgi:hypothetical protein
MKANPRAAVAYIAGRFISGKHSTAVYDYALGKHISFSGTVQDGQVNAYDHDQGCSISGSVRGGHMALYHYGDGHHINLNISEQNFDGHDYGTSSNFS